ncbi:GvpL/GvpF family gas vesicle protein [Sphaerisporangium sp. TRM90804]|uniref:GvpL/GvpF family gas vesicle protein n=1 Tax=Sphaerisporangium sp. TRM90804 TaxID=3031113 RepID=UPI0024497CED|nr:GvpL/GvpF family gas vesicle protein [Sphaerisporangium sp. TRM90804]MDH2430159.1 GvpL/GvpF family gas vesicle protein [Sphaerisporangium sp. TRM90804]
MARPTTTSAKTGSERQAEEAKAHGGAAEAPPRAGEAKAPGRASPAEAPRGPGRAKVPDGAGQAEASGDAERGKAPPPAARAVGIYVYGVVPADVELTPEPRGVGEPPGEIGLVRHGDVAALVSPLHVTRPIGKPQDLVAHQQLLDDVATEVPVLPFRFGAVLESPEAIVGELLTPHHDQFASALAELEGRVQFVVKARYDEHTVLREVLVERPEAARMRDQIRDLPEDASWDARIRLGELVNEAIEAKRDADTRTLAEGLAPHAVAIAIRPPTHEEDAAHLAVLVETERQAEFEEALDGFGVRWDGRITLRLLGPQAPYDFVQTRQEM